MSDGATRPGASAIVTGSATGIGRAIALALAEAGCNIVVNYTRSEREARDCAEAAEARGAEVEIVRADVSSADDCARLVEASRSRWGRLDVLVNNAGFTRVVAPADLEELTEEIWDRTFEVNVKGAFLMTRAAASLLKEAHGTVVNVSSTAGFDSVGSSLAYSASKAALNNLTVGLARALGPEVRVNAVAPGFVETRWNERALGPRLDAMRKLVSRQTPLGGVAQPHHVAQAVLALVTSMDWVTGHVVTVDGGMAKRT